MRSHWKSVVMVAALALFLGISGPAWSQLSNISTQPLSDPLAEDYAVHVIPFYKINEGWFSYLVVADTSWRDFGAGGNPVAMTFYNQACNLVSDATVNITTTDAQYFLLHDPNDAQGQWASIPPEGVILLDGRGRRFLTYVLLINGNDNSMIRMDSIPCQGPELNGVRLSCSRGVTGASATDSGTWLRYDTYNTVAATFGHSDVYRTYLYFFSAPTTDEADDLRDELRRYGLSRHNSWAEGLHVNAWCDEIFLGSRRIDELECTQRVGLSAFNFTRLSIFPHSNCRGKPGHIEFFASDNGTDVDAEDFSGFQETIAALVPPVNLIGTGYMHHSEWYSSFGRATNPPALPVPTLTNKSTRDVP
jgi:hypothetical protein